MNKTFSTLISSSLLAAGLAAGSSLIAAPSASAFTLKFEHSNGSTNNNPTGAYAKVDFNFSEVGNDVQLQLDVTNGPVQSKLMAFGLDWTLGDLATEFGITATNNSGNNFFKHIVLDDSLNGNTKVNGVNNQNLSDINDIFFSKNSNIDGGNPNGALEENKSTTISLTLDTNMSATDTEQWFEDAFNNNTILAAARFQSVTSAGLSDKLIGGLYEDLNSGPRVQVPEPSSIAALAFIGGGMFLSRRRQSK
ncbi:MAG: PEP-CTERM sorting domain-containing protein [Okeania sp. SIO3I5]|uniref:PEP-CTERM sorting domain-containing protein n=1 Tax=Okeania sp. SIO3I5 TaxID=2607805 RepID=UPI0013BA243D|nr:PEP-CTERM sorting domain-containing protein [Okeania sp. SIO3I5]NEQ38690.1 PEP-CTERM sorting domain-containing protein [Okeania sp. SIO3I5]